MIPGIDDSALERIGWVVDASGQLAIGEINAAFRDDRSRVATADLRAPQTARTAGRKFLDDASFGPDGIAIWAEPLGPVRSESGRYAGDQSRQ